MRTARGNRCPRLLLLTAATKKQGFSAVLDPKGLWTLGGGTG